MTFYALRFVQRGCGAPAVRVGQEVPEFTVTGISPKGPVKGVSLKGGPHLLFFFATWCRSCRSELPVIHRALASETGLSLLAISDESAGVVSEYLEDQKLKVTAAGDGWGAFASFGIRVLPTVVVVGADGRIVFAQPGSSALTDGLRLLVEMTGE